LIDAFIHGLSHFTGFFQNIFVDRKRNIHNVILFIKD
jgi:hypothetical protein